VTQLQTPLQRKIRPSKALSSVSSEHLLMG
jgi:hypothetical protein